MSDKILRDELLRSHRYRTLSSDTARLLFIHLVLCADSLGNCEATTTALGDAMGRSVDESTAAKWLSELADSDIIRVYESGGKRYVHIPRFRQRLRYPKGKHPRPPANIECSEIRELAEKVRPESDRSQTTVGPRSDEVKRSEVKRGEEPKVPIPPESATPSPFGGGSFKPENLFDIGIRALRPMMGDEAKARRFIGKLLKDWDESTVRDALIEADGTSLDPVAYVQGVLKHKEKKRGSRTAEDAYNKLMGR